MGPVGCGSAFDCGVTGVNRALEHFERAAADVLHESTEHHPRGGDTVAISEAARDNAQNQRAGVAPSGSGLGAGLEGALIDTRVAKYSMVANLRTLQTADEMTKELLGTVDAATR